LLKVPDPLQDEVTWECFCRRLLDEQEHVSPGRLPNFDAPAALRAQLGLPSFRALYQVGCAAAVPSAVPWQAHQAALAEDSHFTPSMFTTGCIATWRSGSECMVS
jgi:hypothetical protein